VRDTRYHGSFDHPVRSFLIGVSLLVLLFGGFVVGVEAGGHPSSSRGTRTLTLRDQRLRVVTVQQPVVRTTVGGATTIVRLLGPGRTAAVVKDGDSTLFGYLSGRDSESTVPASAFRRTGTIFVPEPTTVTETVTETTTETVTETATDGGTTDTTSAP
jgi:ABC-type Fe3+-hydroxamate transport system substrate-binding protein